MSESTRYYRQIWRTWDPLVEAETPTLVTMTLAFGPRRVGLLLVTEPRCEGSCFESFGGRMAPRLELTIHAEDIDAELAELHAQGLRIWAHYDAEGVVRLAELTYHYENRWVVSTPGQWPAEPLRSQTWAPRPQ